MKKEFKALALMFMALCFAPEQGSAQEFNPERVMNYLDRNKDKKLSKQEVSNAQRLATNFTFLDTNKDGFLELRELKPSNSQQRYTYLENDGIYMYYETEEQESYRALLPPEFDMPQHLLVYTFICDFYKMDSNTQPYKEASIFLLANYKGKEIWHCVYMPVSSRESMLAGKYRLGLPKTMGQFEFLRSETEYKASLLDENKCKMALSINTGKHLLGKKEKELMKELSVLPKMNILNGEVVEMSGGKNGSVFDLAETFPNRLVIKEGEGTIDFNTQLMSNTNTLSALHLKPSKIVGAYYMINKIPFRLGKK